MPNKSLEDAQADLQAYAREKIAEVIAQWRAEGQTVDQIEQRLGRRLPPELRK